MKVIVMKLEINSQLVDSLSESVERCSLRESCSLKELIAFIFLLLQRCWHGLERPTGTLVCTSLAL